MKALLSSDYCIGPILLGAIKNWKFLLVLHEGYVYMEPLEHVNEVHRRLKDMTWICFRHVSSRRGGISWSS